MIVTDAPHYIEGKDSSISGVKSLTNGVLIPRMRHSEMLSVPSPATGLMVYNIDDKRFYYFDGDSWISIRISPDYLWARNINHFYSTIKRNVWIGTQIPSALLNNYHIDIGAGNMLIAAAHKDAPDNLLSSFVGTNQTRYPDITAFSSGNMKGTQWNKQNIGNYATAMGFNTFDSGPISPQWIGKHLLREQVTMHWIGNYKLEEDIPEYFYLIDLFLFFAPIIWDKMPLHNQDVKSDW
jgi:hypothetical protein